MRERARELASEIDPADLVAYAIKANSAGSVLRALFAEGLGADVVSGAELTLALAAGARPDRVVMSGVAKTDTEIDLSLERAIRAIQVESLEELLRVAARARALGKRASIALRVNPAVHAGTHAHVATGHDQAKFGIPQSAMPEAFAQCDRTQELDLVGISTHVGSTLMQTDSYLAAAEVVCRFARQRRTAGKPVRYLDFGGGFGIDYGGQDPEPPAAFARAVKRLQRERELGDHALVLEPGRSLVGGQGLLLSSVVQIKVTDVGRWLMLDAGMNDLLRPALYQARHRIEAVDQPPSGPSWQVVGPVCESADDFGIHEVSDAPRHVVVRDAGAYGFTMASNYNGRTLPQEVFLAGGRIQHLSPTPDPSAWVDARLRA
jgi:diaminopimelate decarboxylase